MVGTHETMAKAQRYWPSALAAPVRLLITVVFGVALTWSGPLSAANASSTARPDRGATLHASRVGSEMAVGLSPTVDGRGFWVASGNGVVTPEGDALAHGDAWSVALNAAIVGIASTVSGLGYWLVASDGGIFSFGDARFYGSTGALHLNQPIVGMASTPDGDGYWLVASDGGIFSFGDARFYGSTGALHLNEPIVGMASTPDGDGYWLVASDGGIFSFGDARFYGSTGALHLNEPIVGMASTPDSDGYWLVASDGGIFSFGDAGFHGSTGGVLQPFSVIGMVATGSGQGYWVVLANGQVRAFGDASAIVTTPVLSDAPCAGNPAGTQWLLVSISEQQLWACQGADLASTSAVTTGAYALPGVQEATPTGTWNIQAKMTGVHLRGCNAAGCWDDPVQYWMPYDGAFGFHDASWQTFPFGSPAYATAGSHGCVHLPGAEMSWVYGWAPIGTRVTIRP